MTNLYSDLPDTSYWRRSVSRVDRHLLDPVVASKFRITRGQAVATAGSCFAQHIARKLRAMDFNYLVAEKGDGLDPETALRHGYGVFSARFGNIYTARQLLQLYQRAYGIFEPKEDVWQRPDGRYADPFRPNVEPDGFASAEALRADRQAHLAQVRDMFATADVFVFTMGLTEGWRSREDGAVFPVAPGVVAGDHRPEQHEFVNFNVDQTFEDMSQFLRLLKSVNDKVKVLLTVSPVPLVATYEPQHVLTATTYSKSVLRVVAEQLLRAHDWVDYFPSFEIITGSFNAGMYYQSDAREVAEVGVAHVMRSFVRHYLIQETAGQAPARFNDEDPGDIVCDEEALDPVRI